jgi:hypothetical protein
MMSEGIFEQCRCHLARRQCVKPRMGRGAPGEAMTRYGRAAFGRE